MAYAINDAVSGTIAPPIAEAYTWIPPGKQARLFINLSQAVPGYPPADALKAKLAGLVHDPGMHLYTDILGTPELREAFAQEVASDYRGSVVPDDIAVTAGCNQAFCIVMAAIAKPGDNVLLPLPYFFNHHMWLGMQALEPRLIGRDASALPQPRLAEKLIDGRTRAIVLVSPDNPTGAIYPPELIDEFYELSRRHGIALVLDETYKDFRGFEGPPHGLFMRPDWRDAFIHLYSFSKVFALTGYRVGAIAAAPRLIAEIEKLTDCVAICAPRLGQEAALFALAELGEWRAAKAIVMADRLKALRAAFAHPAMSYRIVTSGAFFAWLEHPFEGTPAKEVARRLARDNGLLVLPGSMFGPGQEAYLRLAFANVEGHLMPEVAERLIDSQNP